MVRQICSRVLSVPSREARHHSLGRNCSWPAAHASKICVMGGQKTPGAASHCTSVPTGTAAWLELKCFCTTLQARPGKWAGQAARLSGHLDPCGAPACAIAPAWGGSPVTCAGSAVPDGHGARGCCRHHAAASGSEPSQSGRCDVALWPGWHQCCAPADIQSAVIMPGTLTMASP